MSLTILTETGVNEDWDKFLNDKAIDCPITFEEAKAGETGTGAAATDAGFVATAAGFFGLKFKQVANGSRFGFNGVFPDPQNKDVIVLGLEQTAKWTGSIVEMLTAFTGEDTIAGSGVVAKVLTALAKNVKVSLVNESQTRNGIWCVAGQTRVISTALVFALDPATALGDVGKLIKDELAIDIAGVGPLTFHLQRTSYGTPRLDENRKRQWSVTDAWAMTIQVTISGFDFWLQQDSGDTSVILTQNEKDPRDIWTKLSGLGQAESTPSPAPTGDDNTALAPNKPPPSSASKPSGPDIAGNIDLLSISMGRNLAQTRWWEIKTVFLWDVGHDKKPIMIGLSYSSLENSFVGELLTKDSFQSDKRLMTYRASADVAPRTLELKPEELPDVLFLSNLFAQAEKLPDAIPNSISVARVTYSSEGNATSNFGLEATLVRHEVETPNANTNAVPCPFTWDSISFYARRVTTATPQPGGKTTKVSAYSFGATASFALHPREQDKDVYNPAVLTVSLDYDDDEWRVEGHVQDLNFGALVGLMDPNDGVGDAALDILGKLSLTELNVLFTYKDKKPSSFLATGIITLGALELRLFYQYVGAEAVQGKTAADLPGKRKQGDPAALQPPKKGDPATWKLRAYLGAAGGKKATIGEIIDSIDGSGEGSDNIPEFIKSIEVAPADTGADSAVSFEVTKNRQGAVVFVLSVNVLGIRFTYMQFSSKPPTPVDGSLPSGSTTATKPQTTRILRIAIDKLPLISDIPLVSQLGQPFDKMLYLYVSGDKGLLQHELDAINEAVTSDEDKLAFKRAVAKPSLKNPVINMGHHFMVIQGGDVVLDHVFDIGDDEKKPVTKAPDKKNNTINTLALPSTAGPPPTNTPTKGSLSKSMGPLTISALTLEYKSKTLHVQMDATLTLGPISIGLLGFGIGFLTTGLQLNDLSKLVTEADERLSISLRGMSIAFDRPPVLIAGMFEHDIVTLADKSVAESYKGGVGIGFPPYTFIGVGEYSDVKKFNADGSSAGGYKSIFLFAKLDGPLVTLEFATISGVRLGFGFNSIVRSPKIDELTQFPFIKSTSADGAARNPMAILKSMTPGWVTPREGSYWVSLSISDLIMILTLLD